jgi:UDP-2-acetamido-2-deoxy-ribo-hexuluronate aminotransferase
LQFIDLKTQYNKMEEEILSGIKTVLNHGQYIMGPEVNEIEKKLADFAGTKFCVSCASGTDALLMPLMAFDISPGDAVFTTPFTFIATAEVIQLLGATPVFVDIEEDTFNICPIKLEQKIKEVLAEGKLNPKVIIPVDLFGLPSNYNKISQISNKFGLKLIVDSAQGFGASIDGEISCGFGDVGATSFFPAKPLGCYGDGGAIFTDDNEIYEKLVSIRVHGKGEDKYNNVRIGINGRLDTIQASILLTKLKYYNEEIKLRNKVANNYFERLGGNVSTQYIPDGYKSVWAQFSVLASNNNQRELLQTKLKADGVPSAIYYPKPLHLQIAFNSLGYKLGDFPISEMISNRIFSLPMHPYLKEEDIIKISKIINEN